MLNDADASGFKKYTSPWASLISGVGLMVWQRSCAFSLNLTHMTKTPCFCSVEEEPTGSKHYYGKEMDSSLCTKGLIMAHSDGRALRMKQ